MNDKVLAWHFLKNDHTTSEGSIKVFEGQTLTVDGQIELCEWGLHWSIQPLDALQYAPGNIVQRVEVGGEIIYGDDKGVSSERTCLWLADATRTLHEFGLWAAEDVLARNNISDSVLWKALEVKRLWLDGQATDEELYETYKTTSCAAYTARYAAAYRAVSNTVSNTAFGSAVSAAYGAALYATWGGVGYNDYSEKLEEMLLELQP